MNQVDITKEVAPMNYMFLRYPGGKAKAVTLSYDDGCRDDMRLVETLNRHGIKCTFNPVGSSFGHASDHNGIGRHRFSYKSLKTAISIKNEAHSILECASFC